MSIFVSLSFSNSNLSTYFVGFVRMRLISSPLLTSNSMSPASPKRLPFFVTTVFPMSARENFLSSSAMLSIIGHVDIFKLCCHENNRQMG